MHDVFPGRLCEATTAPPYIPADAKLVDLKKNNIRNIEMGMFLHLNQCTELNMAENSLTHITPFMFQGLQSLDELDLSSNEIRDIEPGALLNLIKCTKIRLQDNQLTCLRQGIFEGLISLEILELSRNSISVIEPRTFSHTPVLRILYLNDNQLITLMDKLNQIKSKKSYLYLGGNPLQCDSRMCWIKQAEQVGWLKIWGDGDGDRRRPQCRSGSWDNVTVTCDVSGKRNDVTFDDLLFFFFP